jgi:hypothetical protein
MILDIFNGVVCWTIVRQASLQELAQRIFGERENLNSPPEGFLSD